MGSGNQGYWVACSKNVGMIFQNFEDIEKYTDGRFEYSKMIGKCWLMMIENMKPDQVCSLKDYLVDHTFVGEYCGNK